MSAASPWGQDRTVGLPISARLAKRESGRERLGTEMPYEPEHSQGGFPVRFDDGFWEVLDVSHVTVVARSEGGGCTNAERSA